MSKGILEQSLPSDIVRHTVKADDATNLQFIKSQLFFEEMPEGQDSMLFETITVHNPLGKSVKKEVLLPDRKPCVLLHHSFPRTWQVMQDDQKKDSICHRTYWLGEAWTSDKINQKLISEFLVKSLAERVKRFKKDVGMNFLIPFDRDVYKHNSSIYEVGEGYQSYFYGIKGQSKYDWDIVNKFAKGEKIEPISDMIFCYETPIITEEEIALVYEELKRNPEPRLERKSSSIDNQSGHNIDKLVNAIGQLTELQTQSIKKGKENGTKTN